MSFLFHTSGSVGDLGGQPPRSTRPPRIYLPGPGLQGERRTSTPISRDRCHVGCGEKEDEDRKRGRSVCELETRDLTPFLA